MKRRLVLAAIATTLGLLVWVMTRGADRPVDPLFGGPDGLAIVTGAERIEAFRIAPAPGQPPGGFLSETDYQSTAGPVVLDARMAQEVTAALGSSRSYSWDSMKKCTPRYGVRLAFIQGEQRMEVYLCFECDMLETAKDGTPVDGEDFDAIRPVLVRAAKSAFPSDPVIQGLAERR